MFHLNTAVSYWHSVGILCDLRFLCFIGGMKMKMKVSSSQNQKNVSVPDEASKRESSRSGGFCGGLCPMFELLKQFISDVNLHCSYLPRCRWTDRSRWVSQSERSLKTLTEIRLFWWRHRNELRSTLSLLQRLRKERQETPSHWHFHSLSQGHLE